MKYLIVIIALIIAAESFADEVTFGNFVHHFVTSSKKIPVTLVTPMVGYRRKLKNDQYASVFVGKDCIKAPIVGGAYSKTVLRLKDLSVNVMAGGYIHSKRSWNNKKVSQLRLGVFVPIGGIELNQKIGRFNINAIVGPITVVSFGIPF